MKSMIFFLFHRLLVLVRTPQCGSNVYLSKHKNNISILSENCHFNSSKNHSILHRCVKAMLKMELTDSSMECEVRMGKSVPRSLFGITRLRSDAKQ